MNPTGERKTHPVISWNNRLIWVLACCAVGACKAVETTMPRQATLDGLVEFSMSGGLSGSRQGLTIYDSGLVEARDEKRGKTARGQLDPARLAGIRAAFLEINSIPESTSQRLGTRCADCYQYALKATIDGRQYQFDASSAALQASPYSEIVRVLSQITRETLSRPATPNE